MRIRQKTIDVRGLRLSPEEGFVLSRIEGTTTVSALVALTGLDPDHVAGIVEHLRAEGVVEIEADANASEESDRARGEATYRAEGVVEIEADANASEESDRAHGEATYRKLYDETYGPLTCDERVAAALTAKEAHLLALCFDPDPRVVHAVLGNVRAGLDAARLIAAHHRTQIGLERLTQRADFAADALVQRRLLRNPQLPAALLRRLVGTKLLMDVYKVAIDREISERSRVMMREVLRKKFMLASSDERAALLFKTEGRCLALLVACSLDANATQILSSKSTFSVLFIQNLARWSATPPSLLAHLLRMQVVRRNPGLRKVLLRHPNVPSELKRSP